MHVLGALFVFLLVAGVVLVLVWNFVPGVKQKLSGWTTVLEGILSVVMATFGTFTGALQEAQQAGYLPSQLVGYLPWAVIVWMIFKRFRTTEPVGVKKR